MPHTDAIVVMTTLSSADDAVKLVRALLDRRLIACGTVLPGGRSLYRWQGKIEDTEEVPLLIKTTAARYNALEAAIRAGHPYELPEIIAVPVACGLSGYLAWVAAETEATNTPC